MRCQCFYSAVMANSKLDYKADSGLFTKKFERFPDYQGEAQFLVTHGCFPKSQLFSKSTLNLARFDTKFVAVRKIMLSVLWQGSLGSSV